ncbi:neprilysin-1-like isoform X1 [Dermacentor silvarum]|uniref:neprilysin-1-like isoform X1 n=1 Tax=Dermacentor silvarum TaxID=543639 RepID=UPI00189A8F1C|nr:neprilysin-1-like isoform X1 [Dermacentor silvarum]
MKAVNLVLIACLLTSACFALSVPIDNEEKEYPVCDTPVCIQRAKLINESLNTSVDPCEDFYSYACGGWIKNHPVPNDKSTMDSFTILSDELRDTLRDLLNNLTLVGENQTIIDKAALFYNSCVAVPDLDDQRDVMFDILNASGLGDWPRIGQEANISEGSSNITDVIIKTGMSSILSFGVSRDIRELSTHVIQLDQIGFSWVGRKQMINQTTNYSRPMVAAYKTIIQVAMKFIKPNLSDDNITELSERLLAFEGQLANLTAPPEERRDINKLYHRTTMEELHNNFTYIPIRVLLKKVFNEVNITLADNETIELYALDYYTKLNNFLECADPDMLYNYAGLKVMLRWAAAASESFRNATFELVKVQSGVSVRKPRWELCIGSVKAAMPEIIGKLYVQHKFSEEAKREVEDLAKRLMSVFNKTLQTIEWMDNTTRNAAEEKLTKMGAKIGYPDWLNNMTYLEELYRFVPQLPLNTSFLEAVYLVSVNSGKDSLLKLRMPYDKDSEWIVGPAVVNAFYSPSSNEMVYPSAILQGVFYEHGLPRSLNFGAIGMVVGHEMTHGFDDTGSQFDADGALKEWWSNRTSAEFKSRAKCFEYQYGNITDKKANMTLNAKNTLGENIADNGGLRLVFEAYKKFLEEECQSDGTRLKGLEEFSGKKLFFVANAMAWCSVSRPEYLKLLIQYDPHSPSQYRVNLPMSNMPDFSETFGCPANSTMNRKERCTLW